MCSDSVQNSGWFGLFQTESELILNSYQKFPNRSEFSFEFLGVQKLPKQVIFSITI
jgi:hypothetical protein